MGGDRGNGEGIQFLRRLVGHEGDECVTWPLSRVRGYGGLSFEGKTLRAHRVMCELAHGPAPSPGHEAAHSCGRGHLGCVNPKHLSWKTSLENQRDRLQHGTAGRGNAGGRRYKLTRADVETIRALLGVETVTAIAARFNVHRSTINQIQAGKIWGPDTKPSRVFTPQEVLAIKADYGKRSLREIAADYGVGHNVIWRVQQRSETRDGKEG